MPNTTSKHAVAPNTRDCHRFFDQFGHQTTDESSGHKQHYEQSQQKSDTFLENNSFLKSKFSIKMF